jgi:hypothetical protein
MTILDVTMVIQKVCPKEESKGKVAQNETTTSQGAKGSFGAIWRTN